MTDQQVIDALGVIKQFLDDFEDYLNAVEAMGAIKR